MFDLTDNAGKIAHFKEIGFPNERLIKKVLADNNWDMTEAYWVLMRDLVDNGEENYFLDEEVILLNIYAR